MGCLGLIPQLRDGSGNCLLEADVRCLELKILKYFFWLFLHLNAR